MVAPALSMDASQQVYLAQNSCKRIQSQTCLSYVECSRIYLKDAKPQRPDNEILGPDDVRRYTVDVYLVKNAKPLQWMLASIREFIWSCQSNQWVLVSGRHI